MERNSGKQLLYIPPNHPPILIDRPWNCKLVLLKKTKKTVHMMYFYFSLFFFLLFLRYLTLELSPFSRLSDTGTVDPPSHPTSRLLLSCPQIAGV